mgnify:CR=1 FL=1
MFVVVMGILYALSLLVARWEAVPTLPPHPRAAAVAMGVVLAFVPAFLVMELGLNVWLAVLGAAAYAVAVTVLRRSGAIEARR